MSINKQSGVTTVEFSLIAGLVFLVLFFCLEISRLMYVINTLSEATRRGARYAVIHPCDSTGTETLVQGIIDSVAGNLVAGGEIVVSAVDLAADKTVSVSLQGYQFQFLYDIPGFSMQFPLWTFETVMPIENTACP